MPQPYAYAVVYSGSWFLMAHKPNLAYYYDRSPPRYPVPGVYPAGSAIVNAPNNYALPGGGTQPGDVDDQAAANRELHEELGCWIQGSPYQTWTFGGYSATYYDVSPNFQSFVDLATWNFGSVVPWIIGQIMPPPYGTGTIVNYAQIDGMVQGQFGQWGQYWPHDNELDWVQAWDIANPKTWAKICEWQGNPTIGWYYEILRTLRCQILLLPGAEAEGAGRAAGTLVLSGASALAPGGNGGELLPRPPYPAQR
jgi:8-oxo-dGTP pyrophosphatase MutT (NUDIX family)